MKTNNHMQMIRRLKTALFTQVNIGRKPLNDQKSIQHTLRHASLSRISFSHSILSQAISNQTSLGKICVIVCLSILAAQWQVSTAATSNGKPTNASTDPNLPSLFPVNGSTGGTSTDTGSGTNAGTSTDTNASTTGAGSAASCSSNTGDPACAGAGNPINVMTGNKYKVETDLPALPGMMGIEITRHYNSLHMGLGQLGYGWRLGYEIDLTANPRSIHINKADGSQVIFNRSVFNPSDCACQDPSLGHVMIYHTQPNNPQGDEYTWFMLDGKQLHFNHMGKLERIQAATGESVHLTRGLKGELLKVTDPQGRSLIMHYADKHIDGKPNLGFKGIVAIDTPVGRFNYQHNNDIKSAGISNLTQVSYPQQDASHQAIEVKATQSSNSQANNRQANNSRLLSKTYHYGEAAYVDAHMHPASSQRPQIPQAAHLLTGTSLTWQDGANQYNANPNKVNPLNVGPNNIGPHKVNQAQVGEPKTSQPKTERQRTWMYDAYGRGILSIHGTPHSKEATQQVKVSYRVLAPKPTQKPYQHPQTNNKQANSNQANSNQTNSNQTTTSQIYPRITHNGQLGQTIITNSQGQATTYNYTLIAGEYRLLQVIGAGCSECAEPNIVYGYDKLGRQTDKAQVSLSNKTNHQGQPVYQALNTTHTDFDQAGRILQISHIGYINGKAQPAQLQIRYAYAKTPTFPQLNTAQRAVLEPVQIFSQPSLIAKPSVINGREHQWRMRYNQYGQPTQITETGYAPALPTDKTHIDKTHPATPISRTTTYTYTDINSRSLLSQIDGVLPNAYQSSQQQRLNTPANSDITQYHYDKLGQYLIKITAPNNRITQLAYDTTGTAEAGSAATGGTGRVVQTTLNDGARMIQTNTTYSQQVNSLNQPTNITRTAWLIDTQDSTTIGAVDARSRQTTTLLEASYNAAGQRTMHMGAEGDRQTMKYNHAGLATQMTNNQGESLNWAYDTQGKLLAQVSMDANDKVIDGRMWLRDEAGKLRATLTPNGIASVAIQNPIPINPNNNKTGNPNIKASTPLQVRDDTASRITLDDDLSARIILKDDFGRTMYERHPEDGSITTTFKPIADMHGANKREPNKRKVAELQTQTHIGLDGKTLQIETLRFNFAGQLVSRTRSADTHTTNSHPCTETLTYEGAMLKALSGCGNRQTFVRNAFAQIITQTNLQTQIVAYASAVQSPANQSPANQSPAKQTTFTTSQHFAYDTTGKLINRSLPTGQVITYGYINQQSKQTQSIHLQRPWLTHIATLTNQGTAQRIANLLPNRWTQTTLISQIKQQPFNQSITGLQSVQHGNGTQTVWKTSAQQYQHHKIAQYAAPLWVKVSAALNTQNTRQASPFNTPSPLKGEGWGEGESVNTSSPASFTQLDSFGRQTQLTPSVGDNVGKTLTLQWNTANQLISVLNANTQQPIARYAYDSLGNRVSKTLYTKTNQQQTTYYAYDNAHKVIAEAGSNAEKETTLNITKQYLYTDHRLHSLLQGNTIYAINTDWRGLPQQVTDANKHIVWQQTFDDWGNPVKKTIRAEPGEEDNTQPAQVTLNIRLAGQYYDAETGLHYNIHRYYNPQTHQYISPDPLGTPDGNDRYAYLNGNPHAGIDPLGLFEIPPANAFGWPKLPDSDGGHGDIVRIAFAQYNAANGMRFSTEMIDQIIRNNYNTDDFTSIVGGSGGQFIFANHFDNPNNGPMYTDDTYTTLTESYRDNETVNDTQNSDNWIQNALKQINDNRGVYNQVTQKDGKYDISTIIGRFGQNTHTLADFYAHSNWVDASTRGGKVCNALKSPFTTNIGTAEPTTIEEGYVPYGLNQTTIWDEQSNMANLYTGTVSLSTNVVACNGKTDIGCTADKTTHGYWNKDHDAAHSDDPVITEEYAEELGKQGLFTWKVEAYDSTKPPHDPLSDKDNPKDGVLGMDYFTDTGLPPKQGERIYVRSLITNYHYIAEQLAIMHTMDEINKLYKAASGVQVGGVSLQDVFVMSKGELNTNNVGYTNLPAKNVGVQDEQKN